VTPKTSKRAREVSPEPPAAKSGGPAPVGLPGAPCPPCGDNPASEAASPGVVSEAGPDVLGAAVAEEGREQPLGTTLAERQAQQLKAIRAARTAAAKARRRQSHQASSDPYSKGTRGARKLPPGGAP
jgi:hypothetical protein